MRATTWPASTVAPSRTVISTILPSLLEEMSTVSPSMRPLTKSLPSDSALFVIREHPVKASSKSILGIIHLRFMNSPFALLAVRFLGRARRSRQIGARQPECIHRPYPSIIGPRDAVLSIHHFRVVRRSLGKALTRQLHLLAGQLDVGGAGFDLLTRPLYPGDGRKHIGLDLRAELICARLRLV